MNVRISPDPTTETMLDAALRHAADGWPVFPCERIKKKPLTRNGFYDASTDPNQIRKWWERHPDAMIGMPTGKRSGVYVLDLDIDDVKGLDGITAAAELGELPDTRVVRTPRGGLHCYLTWEEGLGNSRGALPLGIDVRGEGGYVILPPSRRDDDVPYTWIEPPGHSGLAEPPAWLLQQIRSKPAKPESSRSPVANTEAGHGGGDYAHAALEQECAAVANATQGTRNETLNRAAFALGQLVAGAALGQEIVHSRLAAAAEACGLDWQEAEKTIASGLDAGAKEPRGIPEPKRRQSGYPKPFNDDVLTSAGFECVHAHDYRDTNGQLLYQTLSYKHPCGAERMLMRRPGPPGSGIQWVGDAGLVKVPYRWQELADRPDQPIHFCEGEQDADRLAAAGLLATTLAEQKWSPEAAKAYAGRKLILVFRNDEVGRMHEAKANESLRGFALSIRVVRLPELRRGQGVSDWLDDGHSVDELREIADLTPPVGLSLAIVPGSTRQRFRCALGSIRRTTSANSFPC